MSRDADVTAVGSGPKRRGYNPRALTDRAAGQRSPLATG